MKRKLDIAIGVVSVCLVVALGFAANRYLAATFGAATSASASFSVGELLGLAHEGDQAALRSWLVRQGPDTAHRAILAIDNVNDPNAGARLVILRAIESLGAEGFDGDKVKSWALALRSLANSVLHDGPERADFIARSYAMEGRVDEAAAEYRRYPSSPQALNFFGHNPALRSPASVAK